MTATYFTKPFAIEPIEIVAVCDLRQFFFVIRHKFPVQVLVRKFVGIEPNVDGSRILQRVGKKIDISSECELRVLLLIAFDSGTALGGVSSTGAGASATGETVSVEVAAAAAGMAVGTVVMLLVMLVVTGLMVDGATDGVVVASIVPVVVAISVVFVAEVTVAAGGGRVGVIGLGGGRIGRYSGPPNDIGKPG